MGLFDWRPKKVNFFGAPIQKAPEYVVNLRRQLSSSIFWFAPHRSKFGIFTVTKHPSIRAFVPKKRNLKFFCVPDELGSQIVLRIYSESQIFRIFWPIWVSRSLARDTGDRVTPIWAIFKQYLAEIGVAGSLISRARDLETQIGQKIMKILDSE